MTTLRSTSVALAARRPWPGQREQAVDDLGGAERLALDLLEQRRLRIGRIGAVQQHLREARDAGQRRVHFVGDAGREEADRRHLLRDLQLLFEPHPVGDVLDEQDGAGERVAGELCSGTTVALTSRRVASPHRPRVCAPPGQRHLEERGAVRVLPARRPQRLHERRVEDRRQRPADRIGPRHAIGRFERTVPADDLLSARRRRPARRRATRGCSR